MYEAPPAPPYPCNRTKTSNRSKVTLRQSLMYPKVWQASSLAKMVFRQSFKYGSARHSWKRFKLSRAITSAGCMGDMATPTSSRRERSKSRVPSAVTSPPHNSGATSLSIWSAALHAFSNDFSTSMQSLVDLALKVAAYTRGFKVLPVVLPDDLAWAFAFDEAALRDPRAAEEGCPDSIDPHRSPLGSFTWTKLECASSLSISHAQTVRAFSTLPLAEGNQI